MFHMHNILLYIHVTKLVKTKRKDRTRKKIPPLAAFFLFFWEIISLDPKAMSSCGMVVYSDTILKEWIGKRRKLSLGRKRKFCIFQWSYVTCQGSVCENGQAKYDDLIISFRRYYYCYCISHSSTATCV